IEDARRIFDTNLWGLVYGSLAAARYYRRTASSREHGFSIINIGSVLSDIVVPLQAFYASSKHAVKAFTDGLRLELEKDNVPVSITLIKPSGIDTPYTEHAGNRMEEEPRVPPPIYAPDAVAKAIVWCCAHKHRDVYIGSGGR